MTIPILGFGKIVSALSHGSEWTTKVLQREERYLRMNLIQSDVNLKIEAINDVPSRVGEP